MIKTLLTTCVKPSIYVCKFCLDQWSLPEYLHNYILRKSCPNTWHLWPGLHACMSLPGRKSHMRRLHWPPCPRVWLCPGAWVGGPGISRPRTHRLIPDVILASAGGHLSLTSRIFSWKDEEAALEVLLYISDSKDLVTKCNAIVGSINLELEVTKMEHYMSHGWYQDGTLH